VEHATVVRALVTAHTGLLLKHCDTRAGQATPELDSRRHAHDAAADDEEVLVSHNEVEECERG
jgi:hypothetical protein